MPSLLDYKTRSAMKEDPLQELEFFLIESLRYRLVRWSIISSLAVNIVIHFIEFYYFWDNASFLKLVQFGPAHFGLIYSMVVAFLMLIYRMRIKKLMSKDVKEVWSIDAAGPKVKTMIYKGATQTYIYVALCTTFCITIGVLFLSPNASDKSFFYILNLLHQRWHVCGLSYLVWSFCYKMSCIPIVASMLFHPYMLVYAGQHQTFQAMLLIEHINKLTWDFEQEDESDLFNDEEYQRVMHQRLVYCAKWHIGFTSIIKSYNRKLIQPIFPIMAAAGFLLGLALVMVGYGMYMNVYVISTIDKWLASFEIIDYCLICAGLFRYGQAVENLGEKITEEMLNIKHYTFNQSNKTKVLIMIQNSMVPTGLNLTDRLAVNYDLGINMAKGMYSIISVIATTQYH